MTKDRCGRSEMAIPTDLVIGDLDKVVGWNWKAPLPSSINMLDWLPALSRDMGL